MPAAKMDRAMYISISFGIEGCELNHRSTAIWTGSLEEDKQSQCGRDIAALHRRTRTSGAKGYALLNQAQLVERLGQRNQRVVVHIAHGARLVQQLGIAVTVA